MKTVMIVAGGEWQVPLTKTAKQMGLKVVSTNLYENSPAFAFADETAVADVTDTQRNLAIAKMVQPDAVVTDQSDIAVPTVAAICETLDLPGIGNETARLFTNKYEMRKFCLKNHFESPDFALCSTIAQAESFFQSYGVMILKPIDSQSSRGVHLIRSIGELEAAFQDAMQYSREEKAVLAEQYISGPEFTVDGIKTPQGHTVLAISKKRHYPENPNVASELFFSQENPEYDYTILRKQNSALVEAMELPFGLTHAEYKYMDEKFYLIEIAARGGGTKVSSTLVPCMSGLNSNELLLKMALGQTVQVRPTFKKDRCAVLKFLQFATGTVRKIKGLQQAREIAGVLEIGLSFAEGECILPMSDDRSRQGYYIAFADSEKELLNIQEKVESAIVLEYE